MKDRMPKEERSRGATETHFSQDGREAERRKKKSTRSRLKRMEEVEREMKIC